MPSRFKPEIEVDKYARRVKFREGDLSDPRLDLLIEFGMPDDEDRISIQWAGQYFDARFKGYKVELFGVEDWRGVKKKELVPEPLQWLLDLMPHRVLLIVTDAKPGCFPYKKYCAFHVWLCRVRAPDRKIISEEIWQPKNGWIQMMRNVIYTLSDDARVLLKFIESPIPEEPVEEPAIIKEVRREAKPKRKIKHKRRIPRIPKEIFLTEGETAAEALAREGKAHLFVSHLAKKMNRDRETVSNAAKLYKEEWAVINKKFTDTREWLKIYKQR